MARPGGTRIGFGPLEADCNKNQSGRWGCLSSLQTHQFIQGRMDPLAIRQHKHKQNQ